MILVPFSFYFPLQVQLDFFSCILQTHGRSCWDTNLVSAKQKEILAAHTFNHHMALTKFKTLSSACCFSIFCIVWDVSRCQPLGNTCIASTQPPHPQPKSVRHSCNAFLLQQSLAWSFTSTSSQGRCVSCSFLICRVNL